MVYGIIVWVGKDGAQKMSEKEREVIELSVVFFATIITVGFLLGQ